MTQPTSADRSARECADSTAFGGFGGAPIVGGDPWHSFNAGGAASDNNAAEQWGTPEGGAATKLPNPAAPFGGFGGFGE